MRIIRPERANVWRNNRLPNVPEGVELVRSNKKNLSITGTQRAAFAAFLLSAV